MLAPLINEALAHAYDHTLSGKNISDEQLKEDLQFRASKFNLKNPEKVANEIFEKLPELQNNFEQYLQEKENNE